MRPPPIVKKQFEGMFYKYQKLMDGHSQVFLNRIKNMRTEELTNMLRCILCHGLFRFAHTIVECGHTFCHICILKSIKSYKGKNPEIKCPQCHALVDTNYRKSIMKDVFKQSLVDMLANDFVEQDKIILKRVETLFPDFELEYLMEEFKFTTFEVATTKTRKKDKNCPASKLPDRIKEKLGVSFEVFAEMIRKEENYEHFLKVVRNEEEKHKCIELKAKTERDWQFVGINNQMRALNLTVTKLQRFLEKKSLDKISKTEKVPEEWINTYNDRFDIKIYLSIGSRELTSNDNLDEILAEYQGLPIVYSLQR